MKDGQEVNTSVGDGVVMSKVNELCKDPKKYYLDFAKKKRLEFLYENDCRASMWVEEPYQAVEWTILNETKTIGEFTAIAAETYVGDRKWVAYFTLAIPISYGPWRLHGLPGLILEAHSLPDGRNDVGADPNAPELFSFKLVQFKETNQSIDFPKI